MKSQSLTYGGHRATRLRDDRRQTKVTNLNTRKLVNQRRIMKFVVYFDTPIRTDEQIARLLDTTNDVISEIQSILYLLLP